MFNKFLCTIDGNSRIRTHCNTCSRTSIHTVEAVLTGDWGDRDYSGGEEHSLIRCGGCDTVMYKALHWDEQDYDYDEDGEMYLSKNPKFYPPPQTRKLDFDSVIHLPLKVHDVLNEVLHSQANNDLILATVGVRVLIETICRNADCKAKTLSKQIDELETKGLIGADEKALFHQIRTFGNASAHAGEAMTSDQIASGIDMCLDLVDKLFIQPAKKKKMLANAKSKLSPDPDEEG